MTKRKQMEDQEEQEEQENKKLKMKESERSPRTQQEEEEEEEMKRPRSSLELTEEPKITESKRQFREVNTTTQTQTQALTETASYTQLNVAIRDTTYSLHTTEHTPSAPTPLPAPFLSPRPRTQHTLERTYRKVDVLRKSKDSVRVRAKEKDNTKARDDAKEKGNVFSFSTPPASPASPPSPSPPSMPASPSPYPKSSLPRSPPAQAYPSQHVDLKNPPAIPKFPRNFSKQTWLAATLLVVLAVVVPKWWMCECSKRDLEALLPQFQSTSSGSVRHFKIPVYEEPGSVTVTQYLNSASEYFTGNSYAFSPYDPKSPSSRLVIYSTHFLGRLDSEQEDVIAKLKREGADNVVLASLRLMGPGKDADTIDLPACFSGYKCGQTETPLNIELGYYPFLEHGEGIMPFNCSKSAEGPPAGTKANPCSFRNQHHLKNFFEHAEKIIECKENNKP